MVPPPLRQPKVGEAGEKAGSACRRTRWPKRKGPSAASMPVRLRQFAAVEVAITLEQARLVRFKRLANAIDEDGLRGARSFQRVARPDHHVGAAAGSKAAQFPA